MNTSEKHKDDYDSPWKEGMELYFKEMMTFFFPDIPVKLTGTEDINPLIKNCSR